MLPHSTILSCVFSYNVFTWAIWILIRYQLSIDSVNFLPCQSVEVPRQNRLPCRWFFYSTQLDRLAEILRRKSDLRFSDSALVYERRPRSGSDPTPSGILQLALTRKSNKNKKQLMSENWRLKRQNPQITEGNVRG